MVPPYHMPYLSSKNWVKILRKSITWRRSPVSILPESSKGVRFFSHVTFSSWKELVYRWTTFMTCRQPGCLHDRMGLWGSQLPDLDKLCLRGEVCRIAGRYRWYQRLCWKIRDIIALNALIMVPALHFFRTPGANSRIQVVWRYIGRIWEVCNPGACVNAP